MFIKTFKKCFSSEALTDALALIKSKSSGLDKEQLKDFKIDAFKNIALLHQELLSGSYVPQPIKKIEIAKNITETRPIALASIRDKVVQRTLVDAIEPYFDKQMSNMSYGYRRDKSAVKAIGRCRDFINRGKFWVFKSDIDNFFETINHDTLLNILDANIEDKKIVRLISLYLQNGGFKRHDYVDHHEGVHQGDVLSPLLSNIYLNEFDRFLERKNIVFVRYADDFTLFFNSEKEVLSTPKKISKFLTTLSLKIGEDKSYSANVLEHGFSFLGVHFKDKQISIDNERFQKKVSNLFDIAKNAKNTMLFVSEVNEFLDGLSRYYLKLISSDSKQYRRLFDELIEASAQHVFLQRKNEKIKTKKAFKRPFETIFLLHTMSQTEHKETIERIISKGFEKYLATKSYKKNDEAIKKKKQKYAKSFASSSVLYVSEIGTYIGMSKNLITIKLKGKVIAKMPKHQCEQIIIAGKAISLSSNMVKLCVKEGIAIDFVDGKDTPYASLLSFKSAYAKTALMQLELLHSGKNLAIAKKFIKGKATNQLNYLKYLDKYHKELDIFIDKMEKKIKINLTQAKSVAQLMGYEGEISTLYWQSVVIILQDKSDFKGRENRGATDLVNSALNYGYAILYARVQNAVLKAGLALHISFLHSLQEGKPTLVYDLIEEFRAFVVDRSIISMINKNEPLKLNTKGELSKLSRQLIVRNVKERLGTYTRHKKASKKVETIIQDQAYLLSRHVKGEAVYKPFIGKY